MIGVTGASGFIGAHLMTRLGPDGVSLDLRRLKSPEALAAVLRARGVRAIVHLAGPLPGDEDVEADTLLLMARVLDAAAKLAHCHVIFASTIRVHAQDAGLFSDSPDVSPFDGYGRGKAAAEVLGMARAAEHHPLSILRIASVQGLDIHGKARGLTGVFARQAREGNIRIMGAGDSVKDLVDVQCIIDAIGTCLARPPTEAPWRIIPLGSGVGISVGEIAAAVRNISGAEIEHIEADPGDLSGVVDPSAAAALLDWSSEPNLDRWVAQAWGAEA